MIPNVGSFCRFLPEKKTFKQTYLAGVTCTLLLLVVVVVVVVVEKKKKEEK
jgi:hypothetical protein